MRVFQEVNGSALGFWFEMEPGKVVYAYDEQDARESYAFSAFAAPIDMIEKRFGSLSEKH